MLNANYYLVCHIESGPQGHGWWFETGLLYLSRRMVPECNFSVLA